MTYEMKHTFSGGGQGKNIEYRQSLSFTQPEPESQVVEPVYQQDAAYTANIGPLEVLDFGSDGTMDDEIFGGPLLALKSANYWDNMMMPG